MDNHSANIDKWIDTQTDVMLGLAEPRIFHQILASILCSLDDFFKGPTHLLLV